MFHGINGNTDTGLTSLANIPNLTSLELTSCQQITDKGLAQFNRLTRGQFKLESEGPSLFFTRMHA